VGWAGRRHHGGAVSRPGGRGAQRAGHHDLAQPVRHPLRRARHADAPAGRRPGGRALVRQRVHQQLPAG
jgi:hypothetical protein